MKKKKGKKILAILMAALMVVGIMPMDWAMMQADAKTVTNSVDLSEGLKKGQTYGNTNVCGVEVLADMGVKDLKSSPAKVDGVEYTCAVQGSSNVTLADGIPTDGAAFKLTPKVDSSVTFVLKKADNKAYHFVEATGEEAEVTAATTPTGSLKFNMKAGKTYYFYLSGSKAYVYDILFSHDDFQKQVVDISNGLKEGVSYGKDGLATLSVLADMGKKDLSGSPAKVDGIEYTSAIQGSVNVTLADSIPTAGAAFKITAAVDSSVIFVLKKADNKAYHFVESTGAEEEVTAATTPTGTLKFEMKAGRTYYFYLSGSKPYVYGITLEAGSPNIDWSTIAAPVLGTPEVDGSKILVPYTAAIGDDGGEALVVDMYKGTEKVDTQMSKVTGTEGKIEFKPAGSGDYTFKASLTREGQEAKASNETSVVSFVLPLTEPTISTITSKGEGNVEVGFAAVSEATEYEVLYSEDGTTYVSGAKTADTTVTFKVPKTEVEYSFKVVASRGTEKKESAVIKAVVKNEEQRTWEKNTYGNGASASKDSVTGSANDGSVTIKSESGKIVPNSYDGLTFYYTTVPASMNFTLRAKVTVDYWTLSNGQEGFGLMATDKEGGSGWNNSYMAIASKSEYYWNAETSEVTTDTSFPKVTHKIGIAAQEKIGLTKDTLAKAEANDTATIQTLPYAAATQMSPLELRYPDAGNIVGNATAALANTIENPITEMYMTIQKNNTGYFVTYESVDGSYSTTKKYYEPKALEQLDSENVYVGFFASRHAQATYSDIKFTTIAPENDAPAEARPVEKIAVNTSVQSATATGTSAYDFLFSANCDGALTIVDNNDNVIAENVEVKNNTLVKPAHVELAKGKNAYKIYFTPDANYRPGEYKEMESYDTIVIEHAVTYKTIGQSGQSIWVAPDATGSGSQEDPMSIYEAVKYVQPNQQIIITEGTYKLDKTLKIARGTNGTAESPIYMIADSNAKTRPVLDFQGLCAGTVFGGDYWYFQGFDVTGSADGQKGIQVSGSHNTLDQVNTYHNGNTGIQVSRLNPTDTYAEWPAYNLILNCTSYGNADAGYEDADGFAAKLTVGDGNVFDGCIAHHNADDGWDLFAKVQTGAIGFVTIKNSVAYANGYLEDGTNAGNGNGFKMGGDSLTGKHVLENSIAFNNKAKGIDSNSCPDIIVKNCTTFNNESYNVAFYTNSAKNTDFQADGILSLRTAGLDVAENIKPVGTQDLAKINKASNYYYDVDSKTSINSDKAVADITWLKSTDVSKYLNGVVSVNQIERNAFGQIILGDLFAINTEIAPANVGADFSVAKLTASNEIKAYESVPTGDTTNALPFVFMMILSAAMVAGVYFYDKKRKAIVRR